MKSAAPCILLVEDDPVTRAFMSSAAEAVGIAVDGAASIAEALSLGTRTAHAAWLIDANLPDGRGETLLAALRRHHPNIPALAHTASHLRADLDALIEAGFDEVLVKPLPARTVADALCRALGRPLSDATPAGTPAGPGETPVWDDEAATRAMAGNPNHVAALRALFIAELPRARTLVAEAGARRDTVTVLEELHKLRASCGFVGAARLACAVAALRDSASCPDAMARFDHALADTLSTPPSKPSTPSG